MIIATAVAAVSLVGCGRKDASVATHVTASESSVTVTSSAGDTVTTQTAVPTEATAAAVASVASVAAKADTPDYAPVYPGAAVKAASTTTANGNKVGSVTYVTSASPKAVIDFYKPRAAAAGFVTSMDANIGVGQMYAAAAPASQKTLQVIATPEKSGTAVVLSWTSPKS